MNTFKNKNNLRTCEAEISYKFRTMRLGQNLLAFILKKACSRIFLGIEQLEVPRKTGDNTSIRLTYTYWRFPPTM